MSAIAGWFGGPESDREANCRAVLNALRGYANGPSEHRTVDGACLASAASAWPPTDRPSSTLSCTDRLLVVADARIDNRAEIADHLGLDRSRVAILSDADLILAGWQTLGRAFLAVLCGDFAAAIFDRRQSQLTLVRDAGGQRPIYFAHAAGAISFASMPVALLAVPALRRGWNVDGFVNGLGDRLAQQQGYFRGIDRLLPGHLATMTLAETAIERWWKPPADPLELRGDEWAEAYLDTLDSAIRAKVSGRDCPIASHLSAGWDSSAVTAVAADSVRDRLTAYTAAPARAFRGPEPGTYTSDESLVAGASAQYLGIRHEIVRGVPLTLDYLERQARDYQEPARNLINGAWNSAIHQLAADRGARILLNGQLGNLTLNFGGLGALPYWVRDRRIREWWRQATAAAARSDTGWKGVLFQSFGLNLPATLRQFLLNRRWGSDARPGWFLHPDLRRELDRKPPLPSSTDPSQNRIWMVERLDNGPFNLGLLAESGVETVDPLSDRRVMEFSLRLPSEQLLDAGIFRPLARRALAAKLPAAFFAERPRGLQGADWPLTFTQTEAARMAAAIRDVRETRDLLDTARIDTAIARWPRDHRSIVDNWDLYSRQLPAALATGLFIKAFQPTLSGSS